VSNESSTGNMTIRNKFLAFVLVPTIMSAGAGVLYLDYSFGDIHSQSVLALIATPFLYCVLYQPIFDKDECINVYGIDGDLRLKEKLKKYKGTLMKYCIVTVITAFFAINMH
jgi:predicted Na+-dependent transporter